MRKTMTKHNKTEKVKVINIEGMNRSNDYPLTYFTKIIKDFFLFFESKNVSFSLSWLYILNGLRVYIYNLTAFMRTKALYILEGFLIVVKKGIRNKVFLNSYIQA